MLLYSWAQWTWGLRSDNFLGLPTSRFVQHEARRIHAPARMTQKYAKIHENAAKDHEHAKTTSKLAKNTQKVKKCWRRSNQSEGFPLTGYVCLGAMDMGSGQFQIVDAAAVVFLTK